MNSNSTPSTFPVAIVQRGTNIVTRNGLVLEDMAANRDDMINWIKKIMTETSPAPKLIVFPVLSFSGASRRRVPFDGTAVELDLHSHFLDPLVEQCRQHDCYVATTAVEIHPLFPGRKFHSGFVLGPEGLVLRQPKRHSRSAPGVTILRDWADGYRSVLGEAALHLVVSTPIGRLGMVVQSEILVPEAVRAIAKAGAEIIIHPNLEVPWQVGPLDAIKQVRAFENGVYLLSANPAFERLSDDQGMQTYPCRGESMIIGPSGNEIGRVPGDTEGYAVGTVDLSEAALQRAKLAPDTEPEWSFFADIYR